VVDSPEALAEAGAAEFVRLATAAIAARGRFMVALAGGATPRALYARLADPGAPHRVRVPWHSVQVFFGDERQVAPDHPDSNCRMASEALLRRVPIPEDNVHRIRGENPDPDRAGEEYEEILREVFRLAPGGRPRFDLVLLGLGADGHTASLFPGGAALAETTRLAVGVPAPGAGHDRVTLTLPVLNEAAAVVFLVSGAAKGPALRRLLAGDQELPAARVRPRDGALVYLADRDAAFIAVTGGGRS
jgi:6-phosphogluconolactonase